MPILPGLQYGFAQYSLGTELTNKRITAVAVVLATNDPGVRRAHARIVLSTKLVRNEKRIDGFYSAPRIDPGVDGLHQTSVLHLAMEYTYVGGSFKDAAVHRT
jgi:hypothetical protein